MCSLHNSRANDPESALSDMGWYINNILCCWVVRVRKACLESPHLRSVKHICPSYYREDQGFIQSKEKSKILERSSEFLPCIDC